MSVNTGQKRLGSVRTWLWARLVELVIFFWILDLIYTSVRFRGITLYDIGLVLLLAYVILQAHPLAYGFADDRGVAFRQYIAIRFLSWGNIRGLECRALSLGGVRLLLRDTPRWRRTLTFILNPSLRDVAAQVVGSTTPETVAWLREKISSARSGAFQTPPQNP